MSDLRLNGYIPESTQKFKKGYSMRPPVEVLRRMSDEEVDKLPCTICGKERCEHAIRRRKSDEVWMFDGHPDYALLMDRQYEGW